MPKQDKIDHSVKKHSRLKECVCEGPRGGGGDTKIFRRITHVINLYTFKICVLELGGLFINWAIYAYKTVKLIAKNSPLKKWGGGSRGTTNIGYLRHSHVYIDLF